MTDWFELCCRICNPGFSEKKIQELVAKANRSEREPEAADSRTLTDRGKGTDE